MLEIKNVTKYYGKTLGINNISLKINEGEIFGFIGPNGAGKSTTIKCIMNLINYEGNILLNGKVLNKDSDAMKEIIGYLPSENSFYEDMFVKELLKYNNSFYEGDISAKQNYLIKRLDLDINKKVSELSFGNKRKLGIVLALSHGPKLIIMDEASTGLDPIMQNILYELLLEEKLLGNTIFFSSHILSEVKKICDRVAIIKEGKIVKIDNIKTLTGSSSVIIKVESNDIKSIKRIASKVIKEKNGYLEFISDKDINEIILFLSKFKVNNLIIEQPSIEEVFLHYYE